MGYLGYYLGSEGATQEEKSSFYPNIEVVKNDDKSEPQQSIFDKAESSDDDQNVVLDFDKIFAQITDIKSAIGSKKYERGTIFIGDSKQGKSTIVNLIMKNELVPFYDDNIGRYDVRQKNPAEPLIGEYDYVS